MALVILPTTPSVADQTALVTLDGRPFRFRFQWLGRIERWVFDLSRGDGTPIVLCKGLVIGADALRQVRYDPTAPQGVLTLVDSEGQGLEAGFDTLGVRHLVAYFTDE